MSEAGAGAAAPAGPSALLVFLKRWITPTGIPLAAGYLGFVIAGPGERLKRIEEQNQVLLAITVPIAREYCVRKTLDETGLQGMPCADLLQGKLPKLSAPASTHGPIGFAVLTAGMPFLPSRRVSLRDAGSDTDPSPDPAPRRGGGR